MTTIDKIREQFQAQKSLTESSLLPLEQQAFENFSRLGIPTSKNEEWKYTRIASVFNKDFTIAPASQFSQADINAVRLPGHEEANELVFVNGAFVSEFSKVRSASLRVMTLQEASAGEFNEIVGKHLGHSGRYIRDGIHALNSAFVQQGAFVHLKRGKVLEHPVYICPTARAVARR
jgi:Fe-S cluster assembly protein SufD